MNDPRDPRACHVEVLPPWQDAENLDAELAAFSEKLSMAIDAGYTACVPDNAMGKLAFQGTELIEELSLHPPRGSAMIHLNTFHSKADLDRILESCARLSIRRILVVTGDGSERLPRLKPAEVGAEGVEAVTSVELLRYVSGRWPGAFELGAAFNPYEPPEHELAKFERKLAAGASFAITQPLIGRNAVVDRFREAYPGVPLVVEAWMSKKLDLLSEAIGYELAPGASYDPIENLKALRRAYPDCGAYLSLVGFKSQFGRLGEAWNAGRRALRIAVCVKQVPATSDAKIDPETKRIVREGLKAVMNPYDVYALEEALRIRERLGGEVVALTMGPPRADLVLREALSMGVDRAILLSDRAFGGSDTWATSYALSKAIEKLDGVDLALCGKQAIDGDTAQVGPGIAAHLGWAQAASVTEIRDSGDGGFIAKRMLEDGWDRCRLTTPAVLTVVKDINQPRVPTLKGRLSAKAAEIPVWSAADIGADPGKLGLEGSPTRVVKTGPAAGRDKRTLRIEGRAKDCAKALVRELRLRSLV